MVDGFMGDIARMAGGALTPEIAEAFKGMPSHVGELLASPQIAETLAPLMDTSQMQPLVESLLVNVTQHAGDTPTGTVDATADPAPFALPAGTSWADLQGHLEGFADKLQSIESDAQAKLASPDANDQLQGQQMLQQSQALMEAVQSVLQHVNETTVDAVQNLQSNVDSGQDAQGTVVAMAEPATGHEVSHVDQNASSDHPVDHASAPPPHDDGATVDPSA
jgi:hypothetical protein